MGCGYRWRQKKLASGESSKPRQKDRCDDRTVAYQERNKVNSILSGSAKSRRLYTYRDGDKDASHADGIERQHDASRLEYASAPSRMVQYASDVYGGGCDRSSAHIRFVSA